MDTAQDLPDLIALAQANAKTIHDRIAASADNPAELAQAVHDLELVAVDIFAVFEARMQHHFKRGPFSRKLTSLLKDSDQPALADSVHQYYLAINVLKHGKGASHRELLKIKNPLVVLIEPNSDETPESLINVTAPGFFDGLTQTITAARDFLENR